MPFYQRRGSIPPKRHTQFRDAEGNLYWEELVSRAGFASIYSNLYHRHPPTEVTRVGAFTPRTLTPWEETHRHHHLRTARLDSGGDALTARRELFFNSDLIVAVAHVQRSMDFLYRNGAGDEVLFVQTGAGTLLTNFGRLTLQPGDYVVIPRGVIWQLEVETPLRLLVIEATGPVTTPDRYRNAHGQLLEHSPFCERDIRTPEFAAPAQASTPVRVLVRTARGLQEYTYRHHPFDLVGWDGYYYPWIFNIHDFEPITGRIHQPPPVHQTFQGNGFVICSFVPRLFDYHPQAIPAPYAHSNVDSDEIIYYVEGRFMSRKGIEAESITYHPMGLPHGPQPGKIEASIGNHRTGGDDRHLPAVATDRPGTGH
jgi:homogentisate 1,2-dioxygenase